MIHALLSSDQFAMKNKGVKLWGDLPVHERTFRMPTGCSWT